MSDLISRKQAIDEVQRIGRLATLEDNDAVIRMSAVEYILFNLSSVQPVVTDCISRQDAIDTLARLEPSFRGSVLEQALKNMPSAEPKIIHCKDCKYAKWDDERGDYICNGRAVWENHYCGYAKKKGEEHD